MKTENFKKLEQKIMQGEILTPQEQESYFTELHRLVERQLRENQK